MKIKKRCIDCEKEVSSQITKRCASCYTKYAHGKNHPNYKGIEHRCIDCGKKLKYNTKKMLLLS